MLGKELVAYRNDGLVGYMTDEPRSVTPLNVVPITDVRAQ